MVERLSPARGREPRGVSGAAKAGPGRRTGRPERATGDGRSVGELLVAADHTARDLLIDVDGNDAAALLRTWSTVVSAAGQLWAALPATTGPSTVTGDPLPSTADLTMARLTVSSESLTGPAGTLNEKRVEAGRADRRWPGAGPHDPRLLQVADSLTRATELIAAVRTPQPPLTEPERRDVWATQARVMHTLYVGSHAVGVALRQHQSALEAAVAHHRHAVPAGESLSRTRSA